MKERTSYKGVFVIIGVILFLAGAVTAIIMFKSQIEELMLLVKDKIIEKKDEIFKDEYSDFADI